MFTDFLDKAGNLGLSYLDNTYVNPKDTNASAKQEEAKKYEQIQQKSTPAPQAQTIDNRMIMYGGVALGAILLIVLVKK